MKFFKPKFWDRNKISFFSILLFPITLLIKSFSFVKKNTTITHKFSIPIICVGNVYLGGTGKTPLCIEIFIILKNLNKNPVFIRKKYSSFQDETNLQKQVGPLYESKKRIDALNKAIYNKADIAILDDGFQDFSIKKDLSIVCFNEKQWIGNGLVIPSGPLREDLSALNRANWVVINGKKNTNIENEILKKDKTIKIFYIKYKAQNINEFKNEKVVCFAGIANPDSFFNLLKDNNINILEKISFPDHYNYSDNELENLVNKAKENNATLLTTEKDFFRIGENHKKNIKHLKIKVEIENKKQFIEEINKII
ncbi:MAG: tetraacyldisaccharide 4'-kinase [Pelagibacteraceae bacterium]|mgnify:FL=1|nr:tetraacyldisaccharide 4'-kinase [Candidatus Pelagibacter sp.]MDP6680820.1 tetraacyldisaccharide 4'-kinase [Pelagibacteraceae bacterium]MDP6710617.1 tetraacyldisaccharide 4'-kinase [Pelagibacteraceae bacterium]